jgi:hypothetical protein
MHTHLRGQSRQRRRRANAVVIDINHHNISDLGEFGKKHGLDADNVGLPSLRDGRGIGK